MSHILKLAIILFLAISVQSCKDDLPSGAGTIFKEGFVQANGTQFVLDGKPFYVTGVNNHYLTFSSDEEMIRVLDDAVAMGANVVRIFLQPVIGSLDGTTVPTIWDRDSRAESSNLGVNGNFILYWDAENNRMGINLGQNGLYRVHLLVSEAKKRDLKLIIAFLDFWSYTGGAQQMRAWYGSDNERTFFFKDASTRRDYKAFVQTLLNYRNPLTRILYKDESTIFAWELMNEAYIEPDSVKRAWIEEMSSFVKEIDPHHLVSSGGANVYSNLSDLAIETLDFGTWHGYPKYYNWTTQKFNKKIIHFCAIAKRHNKPVLLEEFGYARSHSDQASVYKLWLETIEKNKDCAGWLVWRLVSRQDHGGYPHDEYDQFDIRNDGGKTWQVLKQAAHVDRLNR